MLVLTRKVNEVVCIGDDIEIVVIEARGTRVRLGFRAPSEISIQRKEVAEARAAFIEQRLVPAEYCPTRRAGRT